MKRYVQGIFAISLLAAGCSQPVAVQPVKTPAISETVTTEPTETPAATISEPVPVAQTPPVAQPPVVTPKVEAKVVTRVPVVVPTPVIQVAPPVAAPTPVPAPTPAPVPVPVPVAKPTPIPVTPPAPVIHDACSNIDGAQGTEPVGMVNLNGLCLYPTDSELTCFEQINTYSQQLFDLTLKFNKDKASIDPQSSDSTSKFVILQNTYNTDSAKLKVIINQLKNGYLCK